MASWEYTGSNFTFNLALGTYFAGPKINVSGGQGPYLFNVAQNSAPPGIVINSGILLGNPSQVGQYETIITVTDANNALFTLPSLYLHVSSGIVQQSIVMGGVTFSTPIVIGVVIAATSVLIGALSLCIVIKCKKSQEVHIANQELQSILYEKIPLYVGKDHELRLPKEISPQNIRKISTLGTGFFGQVRNLEMGGG